MERVIITEKDGEFVFSKEVLPVATWRDDLEKHLHDMGNEGELRFVGEDKDG